MPSTTLKQQMNALLQDLSRKPLPMEPSAAPFPDLLPLTKQTRRSLYYSLLEAGAPQALMEEACGMLDGLHACLDRAHEYERQGGRNQQALAYRQTALEVERALSALLHRTLCSCRSTQKD